MTKIVLYRTADGLYTGFSVKGHSGYAEEGSDIVCAGISALTISCVNAMETVAGVLPEIKGGEDGFLEMHLPQPIGSISASRMHDAQVLLRALHQGLSSLADEYKKYIRLEVLTK